MAREGLGIIIGIVLFSCTIIAGAMVTQLVFLQVLGIVSLLLTGLTINFFRDPERKTPDEPDIIIAPADGKIIEIVDEQEHEFLKSGATRVSIFMNVFNVHVNRIPISGKVEYFRYQRGSFLKAYKSEAGDINEQTIIGIEHDTRRVLFKQIAGLIARRIVCDVREGNNVSIGERFGIIKFGSRVDVFLPKNVELKVSLNQKVQAGESILGVFSHEI